MENFIHLPPYENYLSRWINLAHVKNVNKLQGDRLMIIYISGDKEILGGIWAKVVLNILGESEFEKIIANKRYFNI